MEKVIKLLKNRLESERLLLIHNKQEEKIKKDLPGLKSSPLPSSDEDFISQLETAISILENISEKPSDYTGHNSMQMKNTVVIGDPCNDPHCTFCGGKGFITVDQPTTGIKSLHRCDGKSISSTPFKIIYPEWYPKDMRHQPEQPKINVTVFDGNNVFRK